MVELRIGEPTEVPKYTDQFELHVEYMHGDADAYSEGSWFYTVDEEDDLKMHLLALNFISTSPYIDMYDQQKERQAIIEFFESNRKTKHDAAVFMDCFIVGDSTNDHQSDARVESFDVFFHDEISLKRDVSVRINGIKL